MCDSLTDIYFGGTRAEWDAIEVAEYNEVLETVTIHCLDDVTE